MVYITALFETMDLSVGELLEEIEVFVTSTGQSYNATIYQRRLNALSAINKESDAKHMLRNFSER